MLQNVQLQAYFQTCEDKIIRDSLKMPAITLISLMIYKIGPPTACLY